MPTLQRAESTKKIVAPTDVKAIFETCIGCKWSLHLLTCIRRNINRPGALERTADGLTMKVLQERLKKLVKFGILRRKAYATIPPRVEYHLTAFGEEFATILDEIEVLHRKHFGP